MKQALAVLVVLGLAVSGGLADTFYVNRDTSVNDGDAYDNQGACTDVRTRLATAMTEAAVRRAGLDPGAS